jgi:hypothetical protein
MAEGLTLAAWRTRLEARGHNISEPTWQTVTGFTLYPDADTGITVGVEPDPTLYRQYRQRSFVAEPEPEQVFRATGCPELPRGRWPELVACQPPGCWQDFLAGPGSWLLSWLSRFGRVVAWSDHGLPWDGPDCPDYRTWGLEVPARAAAFFALSDGPEASRPRLLSVADERFADAVAAGVLFASPGMRDCYLADEAGTEVYLVHHHEKVVVSIPDAGAREAVLRERKEAAWLFSDVSGYGSSIDDEDEEGDEDDAPVDA